jgi:competence protein ComEC
MPTHPDADHIAGLVPVLSRYRVSTVVEPAVEGDTATAAGLIRAIRQEKATNIVAQRGQVIDLGHGAYLEVLSPDRPLPHAETNTACTVTRLVYGATSFLFDCDAPHGSKTSSSILFVGYVNPSWVVYSRGCDNKYGFPHQETIDLFARFGVQSADTCTDGTVTFASDGLKVWRE